MAPDNMGAQQAASMRYWVSLLAVILLAFA